MGNPIEGVPWERRVPGPDARPCLSNQISDQAARRFAERTINRKASSFGNAIGAPTTPGDSGLLGVSGGFYREYSTGKIYLDDCDAYSVYGAIGDKYTQLGGPTSWLGWPKTEEQDSAHGGRFQTFQHGAIYWRPDTGALLVYGAIGDKYTQLDGPTSWLGAPTTEEQDSAQGGRFQTFQHGTIYWRPDTGALLVYGAIGDKYTQLGGPTSWLGAPTSEEQDFAQGGRAATFEHGAIYWWPDTGAIELDKVTLQYKGLVCFTETKDGPLSSADEPYVIFGVVPPPPDPPATLKTEIYDYVDDGESRNNNLELYRGLPYGLAIGVVLMEHDSGNPDEYKALVKQGVDTAADGVKRAVAAIPPPYGPVITVVADVVLKELGPIIVNFVNDILGTDDDIVAKWTWNVTAKEMVTMARAQPRNFKDIDYHLESIPLRGNDEEGGEYKLYLDLQAV